MRFRELTTIPFSTAACHALSLIGLSDKAWKKLVSAVEKLPLPERWHAFYRVVMTYGIIRTNR